MLGQLDRAGNIAYGREGAVGSTLVEGTQAYVQFAFIVERGAIRFVLILDVTNTKPGL